MQRHLQRAFTLVELSIVLVILGLLVGGVLAGQSLIRASELRAVTNERGQYAVAVNAFKEKYMGIPGDLANATSFWGVLDPDPGVCMNTASTSQTTCNGNGNGTVADGGEVYRFWQHLANAGLIEGTYAGSFVPSEGGSRLGYNAPRSKLSQAGWGTSFIGNSSGVISGDTNFPDGTYGNSFTFGAARDDEPMVALAAIKAEEAYAIDMKLDDGQPHRGRVLAPRHTSGFTTTCVNASDDAYNLSASDNGCALIFPQAF